MPNCYNEGDSYIFTDDTCIFYEDKDVHKIKDDLNKELSTLCKWFFDDKLPIDFGKDKANNSFFFLKQNVLQSQIHPF